MCSLIVTVTCLLAVTHCKPLSSCGFNSNSCGQQNSPYAIGQTPSYDEDPSIYDVHMPSKSAYSDGDSTYDYPLNEKQENTLHAYNHLINKSQQRFSDQNTQRSITVTWRYQSVNNGQPEMQRSSLLQSNPQNLDKNMRNLDERSQHGPANQPTGYQVHSSRSLYDRESNYHPPASPQRSSQYELEYNQYDDQQTLAKPIPRPRHRLHHSLRSESGNQYGRKGKMPQKPVQTPPCPCAQLK